MFCNMIHNRALENTRGIKITSANIEDVWYPAWIGAAESILAEFEAEGLEDSAKEMKKIIAYSKESIAYSKESIGF